MGEKSSPWRNHRPVKVYTKHKVQEGEETDSDATFHVTPNKEWFSDYSTDASGTVRLGNRQECNIAGTGEVQRGSHPIAERQHYHPALGLAHTRAEEEFGLHRHGSQNRVSNDSK